MPAVDEVPQSEAGPVRGRAAAAGGRTRQPWLLLTRAGHPRQALLTAGGLAVAAALSGRSPREIGLVLVTVLVGQAILGWHNDLVDRERDAARDRSERPWVKPVATGLVEPGDAWFAITCAALLVVPLALSNGLTAGLFYLVSVLFGLMGNLQLRGSAVSPLPWAAAYALYAPFLSFGGWGADGAGGAPTTVVVLLSALLGIGVHFLTSLPGLVDDHAEGQRHLPLRIALRTGAPRLLILSAIYTVLVAAALVLAGLAVGLRQ